MTDIPKPIQIAQLPPEQERARQASLDAFLKHIQEQVTTGNPKMTKIENLGSINDINHPPHWDKISTNSSAMETLKSYLPSDGSDAELSLRDRGVPLSEESGKYFLGILAQTDKHKLDPEKLNSDFQALRENQDPKSYNKAELQALKDIMQDFADSKLYKLDKIGVVPLKDGMHVLMVRGESVEAPSRSFLNLFYANSNPYLRGIKVGEVSFEAPTSFFQNKDNLKQMQDCFDSIRWQRQ